MYYLSNSNSILQYIMFFRIIQRVIFVIIILRSHKYAFTYGAH